MNFLKTGIFLLSLFSFQNLWALSCGETITESTTLTEDLDCTGHTGFALIMKGSDSTLNGNGFKIIAPNALVGVYAEGINAKVTHLEVEGGSNTIAFQAYNAKSFDLDNIKADNQRIGIDFTYDNSVPQNECGGLIVKNSSIKASSDLGIKMSARTCPGVFNVENTSFQDSQNFAMNINIENFDYQQNRGNSFRNAQNGFLITATNVVVKNVDFSAEEIVNETMLVYNPDTVIIEDSNFSGTNSQGIGLHICDAKDVFIERVVSNGHDVGIKVATDTKQTNLNFNLNTLESNGSAGLLLATLSGLPFQSVKAEFNVFNQTQQGIVQTASIVANNIGSNYNNLDTDDSYQVSCTLVVPNWLGLGRLTNRLAGNELLEDISDNTNKNHFVRGALEKQVNFRGRRNDTRAKIRRKIVRNIGIGAEIDFTFHSIFAAGARDVIESNYESLNTEFREGVAYALINKFNEYLIPTLQNLDNRGKISILKPNLFNSLISTDQTELAEILKYHKDYFPGMDDAPVIVEDLTDSAYDENNRIIGGDDSLSNRAIKVGNCRVDYI